ncbi:hypothetical protein [Kribbella kalugense]|uniref:Uncharacterized protein n=1 Tax=Kribbella kalugense TaxID=2512221 RepID=A0A4R7ZV27_9ACTN|nr:hypothetical protein [Kribbella kalugense]TDW19450.1 hypothetical protein EV650_6059 [Kribbella kalugense]
MTKIDLYEMGSRQPAMTDASDDQRLDEALRLHGGDVLVLVDDEDVDFADLDISRTVGDVAAGRTDLVILRNPLAKVTVNIHYAGLTKPLQVHAATRIRRIRKLAIKALELDAETAADTALRLEGANTDLPLKQPIGIYLDKGQHQISLDLVHKTRPQG